MKKDRTERMVESLVHGVSFGVLCGLGVGDECNGIVPLLMQQCTQQVRVAVVNAFRQIRAKEVLRTLSKMLPETFAFSGHSSLWSVSWC